MRRLQIPSGLQFIRGSRRLGFGLLLPNQEVQPRTGRPWRALMLAAVGAAAALGRRLRLKARGPGRAGRVSRCPRLLARGSPVACHPQPASWNFLPRPWAAALEALGSRSPTPNSAAKFPASLPGWPSGTQLPPDLRVCRDVCAIDPYNRVCRDVCAIEPSPQMPTPADSPLIHPTSWVGPKVC